MTGPRMPPDDAIGVAWMEADGTIAMQLRAEGAAIADGLVRYPPADPHYPAIAAHLGPIRPGATVAVKPFPAAGEH